MEHQVLLIVFISYFLVYLSFLVFSIYAWSNCVFFQQGSIPTHKIALIIAARNEEDSILALLKSISLQDYPSDLLEVIIVTISPPDLTEKIILEYISNNKLKIKLLKTFLSSLTPKKAALNLGVKSTLADILLFTDADCVLENGWVKAMSSAFEDERIQLAFGPIRYSDSKGLEKLLSIEQAALLGSSVLFVKIKHSFHVQWCKHGSKEVYVEKVKGFETVSMAASGDDELLLHKIFIVEPGSVVFVKNKNAIVTTKPVQNLTQLADQRKRWGGKMGKYKLKRTKVFALFVFGFHFTWIISFLYCCILKQVLLPYFIYAFLIKAILEYVFIRNVMIFLGKRINLPDFALLQLIYSIYVVFFGLISRGTSYNWKDRKLS